MTVQKRMEPVTPYQIAEMIMRRSNHRVPETQPAYRAALIAAIREALDSVGEIEYGAMNRDTGRVISGWHEGERGADQRPGWAVGGSLAQETFRVEASSGGIVTTARVRLVARSPEDIAERYAGILIGAQRSGLVQREFLVKALANAIREAYLTTRALTSDHPAPEGTYALNPGAMETGGKYRVEELVSDLQIHSEWREWFAAESARALARAEQLPPRGQRIPVEDMDDGNDYSQETVHTGKDGCYCWACEEDR